MVQRRSLTELAQSAGLSRQAFSYRFLRALELEFKRTKAACSQPGHLILLADGLWFKFKRRPWVVYLMATKPLKSRVATFADPILLRGRESRSGWLRALETIPEETRARVRALVCDNFRGATSIARANGWVLQLCHFHMIAQLRARLGYWRPRGVKAHAIRQAGYRLIKDALAAEDVGLSPIADSLQLMAHDQETPARYARILREFLRRKHDYRAYRRHPDLELPTTTGAVESMGRVIRDLMRRTRSIRTPEALNLWVTNYMRRRPEITCNSPYFYTD